jgi:hypothetical protein
MHACAASNAFYKHHQLQKKQLGSKLEASVHFCMRGHKDDANASRLLKLTAAYTYCRRHLLAAKRQMALCAFLTVFSMSLRTLKGQFKS